MSRRLCAPISCSSVRVPGESGPAPTGATVTTAVDAVGALSAVVVGGVAMDAAATRACGRSMSMLRPDDGIRATPASPMPEAAPRRRRR